MDIRFHELWIVLADARISLFEVDINCDRFHIVQGVLFVKRQTEITFIVHRWPCQMLLHLTRIILSRPHLYSWVTSELIRHHCEFLLLG